MRNGNIILNFIIYYFILNLLSSPFVFVFLYFYEKYALYENSLIKTLAMGIILGWYVLLHIIAYLSAKLSPNHGHGIEDAVSEAFNELAMYVNLSFPFLNK